MKININNYQLVKLLLVSFFLQLYGISKAQNEELVSFNWNSDNVLTIGQTIDAKNIDAWNPSPFKEVIVDTIMTGCSGEVNINILSSYRELIEKFGFDAEVMVRNLNFKLKGKLGIEKETIENNQNLNILISLKQESGILKLGAPLELNDSAKKRISSANDFIERYGDYYIAAASLESQLFILLTFSNISNSDKKDLKVELSASGNFGATKFSLNSKLTDKISSYAEKQNLTINIKYKGIKNPSVFTPFIQQLNNALQSKNLSDTQFHTIFDSLAITFNGIDGTHGVPSKFYVSSMRDYGLSSKDLWSDRKNIYLTGIWQEYQETKEIANQMFDIINKKDLRSILIDSAAQVKMMNNYFYIMDKLDEIAAGHKKCIEVDNSNFKDCKDCYEKLLKNKLNLIDSLPTFPSSLLHSENINRRPFNYTEPFSNIVLNTIIKVRLHALNFDKYPLQIKLKFITHIGITNNRTCSNGEYLAGYNQSLLLTDKNGSTIIIFDYSNRTVEKGDDTPKFKSDEDEVVLTIDQLNKIKSDECTLKWAVGNISDNCGVGENVLGEGRVELYQIYDF